MERNVFADGLEKLALNFGVSDSGDRWTRKVAFLYDQLREFPNDVWDEGVKDMLNNLTKFPALSEMLKCLVSKKSNMECEIVEFRDCKMCDNTGYITTYKILVDEDKKEKSSSQYVFRCNCERGQSLAKRIPFWNEFWQNKGHERTVVYDERTQA